MVSVKRHYIRLFLIKTLFDPYLVYSFPFLQSIWLCVAVYSCGCVPVVVEQWISSFRCWAIRCACWWIEAAVMPSAQWKASVLVKHLFQCHIVFINEALMASCLSVSLLGIHKQWNAAEAHNSMYSCCNSVSLLYMGQIQNVLFLKGYKKIL